MKLAPNLNRLLLNRLAELRADVAQLKQQKNSLTAKTKIQDNHKRIEIIKMWLKPKPKGAVSRRFFVCEDINYLNEMKVISTEFDKWEDADSFRKTMNEGLLYKDKSLLIINVSNIPIQGRCHENDL